MGDGVVAFGSYRSKTAAAGHSDSAGGEAERARWIRASTGRKLDTPPPPLL
jgi:hypothetical protein